MGWSRPLGERHREWLAKIELAEDAAQATLADYRGAIEALLHHRAELERLIGAAIPGSAWEREVALLRCLRGITPSGRSVFAPRSATSAASSGQGG